MVSFPPCKINLGLHIIRKRPDGYHDLETCFYPVPWTDILEIIPAAETSFTHSGIHIPGNPEDNLCLKAYHLLQKDFNLKPVSIHLHKIVPIGAGLGGGSSDAAYTLRLLNQLFALNIPQVDLAQYAAKIGSDCSFFVFDQAMIGKGRGEILSPLRLDLTGKFLVLVKPDVHIATASAYKGVTPHEPAVSLSEILEQPVTQWSTLLQNDFEGSIFEKHPKLSDIKNALYQAGALYASMSGSGSTLFGIFDKPVDVVNFSSYSCWSGIL